MIRGIHGLFYSSDPEATRAFFKEKVRLPGNDIGDGWWIFDLPEGDLGIHPVDDAADAGGHDVSFYCDDIESTVADMKSRGVPFTSDVQDHGYGLVTYFTAPGGVTVQLYQPRYRKGTSRKPASRGAGARQGGGAKDGRKSSGATRRKATAAKSASRKGTQRPARTKRR
jgi:hypothetical protein